jgi:hypothetical protein
MEATCRDGHEVALWILIFVYLKCVRTSSRCVATVYGTMFEKFSIKHENPCPQDTGYS